MISDREAHERGLWFNYTPNQWNAISRQVERIATPREPFAYLQLLEAANVYLDENFRSPSERATEFSDIAKEAERLRLSVAGAFSTDHVDVDQVPQRCLDALEELERWAKYHQAIFRLSWTPKWRFYRTVLECWGDAGGLFKRSRSKPREQEDRSGGQASGPTVLYFEAAVSPVMGETAPGREAICKIIVRHRQHEEEMKREMDRVLREARSTPPKRRNAVQRQLLVLESGNGKEAPGEIKRFTILNRGS